MLRTLWILSVVYIYGVLCDAATDYNKVNNDGSFSFGLSNDDIGGHYHEATGSSDKIVRGRYGSRDPESGRIEETVYTAGPRGFRARGPLIHRKMDLSQYPRGPIGTRDDPLADPEDDPSYSFNYRTADHERRENADSTGRVRGLYSYLDDIGERHTVRYAAGAGTGFEVLNSVPDSPANVAYSSPLYKAPRNTRGRMSTQRGPDGQYKFILSAPDQRRSESSGPDGVVRGSYSYLDDKGIQRTVEYIAGAGIGYRVIHSTTGAGTHLVPNLDIQAPAIKDLQSNDLADDGYFKTSESGRFRPTDRERDNDADRTFSSSRSEHFGNRNRSGYNDRDGGSSQSFDSIKKDNHSYSNNRKEEHRNEHADRSESDFNYNRISESSGSSSADRYGGGEYNSNRGSGGSSNHSGDRYGAGYEYDRKSQISVSKGSRNDYAPRDRYSSNRNRVQQNFNDDFETDYPAITTDRRRLENDRDRDWRDRGRDSTLVKNVGKWYVGLPPGASLRAHVQNIDLLPLGGRQPSPSEALRKDELAID